MEHSVHLVIPAFNRRKIDLSVKDAQSDVLHSWVLLAANVRLEAHQMQTAVYVTSARLDDSRQMAWSAFPTSIATQTLRVSMYQTVLWGPLDAGGVQMVPCDLRMVYIVWRAHLESRASGETIAQYVQVAQ